MEFRYQVSTYNSWETLIEAWRMCASCCINQEVEWQVSPRESLPDRNYGTSQAFAQRYTSEGVELSITAESCSVGNPRDGWGYTMIVCMTMETPNGPIQMNIQNSSYVVELRQHLQIFTGAIDGILWQKISTTLDRLLCEA